MVGAVILTEEVGKLILRATGFLTVCPFLAYVCFCLQRKQARMEFPAGLTPKFPKPIALPMSSQLPLVIRPPLPPWPGKEAGRPEQGVPLLETQASAWGGQSGEVMSTASWF